MRPLSDEEQCEAVIDGLSGIAFRCECGKVHKEKDLTRRDDGTVLKTRTCFCSNREGHSYAGGAKVYWAYAESKGWHVRKRNLLAWRAREKQLLAEIDSLQARIDAVDR